MCELCEQSKSDVMHDFILDTLGDINLAFGDAGLQKISEMSLEYIQNNEHERAKEATQLKFNRDLKRANKLVAIEEVMEVLRSAYNAVNSDKKEEKAWASDLIEIIEKHLIVLQHDFQNDPVPFKETNDYALSVIGSLILDTKRMMGVH